MGKVWRDLPKPQGLYDPRNEHDACGIGFVANIKGKRSYGIVDDALKILENLKHRGGEGADQKSGDGAGILTQIPHEFFQRECEVLGFRLPPEGQLMESLGISRPTLREAFRILEAEGLISVVRGSRTGAKVHQPSVDLVSRYAGYVLESRGTTVADLYQARLAIEPDTPSERAFLKELAQALSLPADLVAHIDATAGAAKENLNGASA